jgi:hypothetical protein
MIKKKYNIGDLVTNNKITGNIYNYKKTKDYKFIYCIRTKNKECYMINEEELRLIYE